MATKSTPAKDATTKVEEAVEEQVLDNELERLIPEPGEPIELSDGTLVTIRPLKVKELFAAFKIITRGSAMSMGGITPDLLDQDGAFSDTLIALLLNAIPEADVEFAEFLRILVDPVAPKGGWVSQQDQLHAENHLHELLLEDPDIGDAIDIITAMVYAESRDIQRLGKKLTNAMRLFAKVTPKTPQK